jgi:hypothetical protein
MVIFEAQKMVRGGGRRIVRRKDRGKRWKHVEKKAKGSKDRRRLKA